MVGATKRDCARDYPSGRRSRSREPTGPGILARDRCRCIVLGSGADASWRARRGRDRAGHRDGRPRAELGAHRPDRRGDQCAPRIDHQIRLAAKHRLPAVYTVRYWAKSGGLASYGADVLDQWRGAASYVDRIFKGEKPAQLPVVQPTKFELVINLKTAKALALTIPPGVLALADEVIE